MLVAALAAAAGALALSAATAGAMVLYDNVPATLPANFASIGFDATSTSQLGGEVELTKASTKHPEELAVTVVMSSWACESGSWYEDNCATTPGATFAWPITLKLYAVGGGGEPVGPLAEETSTFDIPYRPSASPQCRGELAGTWWSTQGKGKHETHACSNGLATPITFAPVTLAAPVPKQLIVAVAYATSYSEPSLAAGPEDSLNVALSESWEGTLSKGTDPTEGLYADSNWSEMYCGSSSSLNTFAFTGTCWGPEGGYQPVVEIEKAA